MLAVDLINAIANTADFKQVPDTDVMDGIVKPWLDLQDANVAKSLDSIQQKHQQIADTHHGFEKNLPKAYQPLVVALRKVESQIGCGRTLLDRLQFCSFDKAKSIVNEKTDLADSYKDFFSLWTMTQKSLPAENQSEEVSTLCSCVEVSLQTAKIILACQSGFLANWSSIINLSINNQCQ